MAALRGRAHRLGTKALVIVPTYNEQHNIRALVDAVLAQDARLEMLVVDDNSPDGTGQTVEEIGRTNPRVHLLSRPGKLGLGTAYRDGFGWALQRPEYELIFEMDADFSHDPAHLPLFLLAAEKADFVLGSPLPRRQCHGRELADSAADAELLRPTSMPGSSPG